MMSDVDWEARYQAGQARWERGQLHPAVQVFQEAGLLIPGKVLVPGGGRSPEPRVFADAGFKVTVIDEAETAVVAQRAALAGTDGEVIQGDLFSYEPDQPFDLIWEQTCLCAIPPSRRGDYAQRLARWLRPGGRLFALFMQTGRKDGPPFDCAIDDMRALFSESDWVWPQKLGAGISHMESFAEIPVMLTRR